MKKRNYSGVFVYRFPETKYTNRVFLDGAFPEDHFMHRNVDLGRWGLIVSARRK